MSGITITKGSPGGSIGEDKFVVALNGSFQKQFSTAFTTEQEALTGAREFAFGIAAGVFATTGAVVSIEEVS